MKKIAIVGLGYVGLKAATAFSNTDMLIIGFDINQQRIAELKQGLDHNFDVNPKLLHKNNLVFTDNLIDLEESDYFIIDVQTPVDDYGNPDLDPIISASTLVAQVIRRGNLVICESTVYPGLTEEIIIPILEKGSGLQSAKDFFVGYSPERIVPGDTAFELIDRNKIIAGQNAFALQKVKALYDLIMPGKLFSASSIAVAEAAKLLENIQRDVNIALINEFAHIMQKMNLSIFDVLEAAKTKWNFLPFEPGFVGGHCIPVDPYYLIHKAHKMGTGARLIEAARSANESLIHLVQDALINKCAQKGFKIADANIVIMGISFKKNVSDTRHSLSIKLYHCLKKLGFNPIICDPLAYKSNLDPDLKFIDWASLPQQKIMVITVGHDQFKAYGAALLNAKLEKNAILIDVPGLFYPGTDFRDDIDYWSL